MHFRPKCHKTCHDVPSNDSFRAETFAKKTSHLLLFAFCMEEDCLYQRVAVKLKWRNVNQTHQPAAQESNPFSSVNGLTEEDSLAWACSFTFGPFGPLLGSACQVNFLFLLEAAWAARLCRGTWCAGNEEVRLGTDPKIDHADIKFLALMQFLKTEQKTEQTHTQNSNWG